MATMTSQVKFDEFDLDGNGALSLPEFIRALDICVGHVRALFDIVVEPSFIS